MYNRNITENWVVVSLLTNKWPIHMKNKCDPIGILFNLRFIWLKAINNAEPGTIFSMYQLINTRLIVELSNYCINKNNT